MSNSYDEERIPSEDYNDLNTETDLPDPSELGASDLKINPDFYIHTALIRAQKCLLKENLKEGFLSYKIFIEHIETLCSASGMLTGDYAEKLKEFTKNLKPSKDPLANDIKIANEKLRLIMTDVFDKKEIKGHITV